MTGHKNKCATIDCAELSTSFHSSCVVADSVTACWPLTS